MSGVDPHFESAFPDQALLGRDRGPLWARSPSDFCEGVQTQVYYSARQCSGAPVHYRWGAAAPSLSLAEETPQGPSCVCHKSSDEQCCWVLSGTPNCVLLRKHEPVECILAVQEDLSAVACHSAQLAKGLL